MSRNSNGLSLSFKALIMDKPETFEEEFSAIQKEIEREQDLKEDLREVIGELERLAREILVVMHSIYTVNGLKQTVAVCASAREMFSEVREYYSVLQSKITNDQYYRFNEMWKFVTQRFVFLASYIAFLESHALLRRTEAAEFLGIKISQADGFHLDLDDLLGGYIQLSEELTRYSLCCATFGDYEQPYHISCFVQSMESKFRALSMKGDSLRKKMEGLKMSSKKTVDIVYDLSIRGLRQDTAATKKPCVVSPKNVASSFTVQSIEEETDSKQCDGPSVDNIQTTDCDKSKDSEKPSTSNEG